MLDAPLTVVLCADRRIEIGLHVTLHSLVANATGRLKVYLFHDGFDAAALDRIGETLAKLDGKFTLVPVAFRDEMFASLPALDGSRYTYVRLLLADHVAEPRFIYLDSDLVVLLDVAELFAQPLDGHIIGVSGMGTVEWQIDKSFFHSRGIAGTAPYFNAGVLLVDADRWRQQSTTQTCLAIAAAHGPLLLSHDQTILNFHFHEQAKVLEPRFNTLLFPGSAGIGSTPPAAIYHFLGRPKPWDFLGEFTNANHALFRATLSQTCFSGYRSYSRFGLNEAKTAARLSRDYLRSASDRLRGMWGPQR
jgi:lipopolysaccharide biosynthesis glycosyltransferase